MSPCRTNLPIRICFVTTFSSAFHLKADRFAQPWQLFSDFIPEFSKTSQIIQPLSANVFPASSLISPWHFEKCESDADVSRWRPRRFLWLDSYGAKLIRQRVFFPPTCINKIRGELLHWFNRVGLWALCLDGPRTSWIDSVRLRTEPELL